MEPEERVAWGGIEVLVRLVSLICMALSYGRGLEVEWNREKEGKVWKEEVRTPPGSPPIV